MEIQTQVFENLSSRYWPHLKLEPFPKSRQLTQNELNHFTIENANKGRKRFIFKVMGFPEVTLTRVGAGET